MAPPGKYNRLIGVPGSNRAFCAFAASSKDGLHTNFLYTFFLRTAPVTAGVVAAFTWSQS